MGKYSLAISLGHNASAVAIKNGRILGGYEEERFTLQKADSKFALNSVLTLKSRFELPSDTDCYVGHWFIDGGLPPSNKYWNREMLEAFFPNGGVFGLRNDFTHHDSHALSAQVFAGKDFPRPFHIFVVDGFGTHGECYSVYESDGDDGAIRLVDRAYGFYNSIGLLYQYATSYCGMRMHQDEYKMLAFEPHIVDIQSSIVKKLDGVIRRYADDMLIDMWFGSKGKEKSLDNLKTARSAFEQDLAHMFTGDTSRSTLIQVAYFVQGVAEHVMSAFVQRYKPENLIVSGGVFYNVKVNSMLADMVPGKFCAMPLAGDQGAALGVYQEYQKDLKWPGHLFWGHRDLNGMAFKGVDGISVVNNQNDLFALASTELSKHGMVNIVRGPMEFGPRALCNTSTLAIPNKSIAGEINRINDRTNEMPFGLVVDRAWANTLFKDVDKVHKSLEYMIVTRDFKRLQDVCTYEGGTHSYPLTEGRYTCRPQVSDNEFVMSSLIKLHGPLINTSFNFHGVPIVNRERDVLYTHIEQNKRGKIRTLVLEE